MFFWRYVLNQVYIFQLENYQFSRYWKVIRKKIWPIPSVWRQSLVWTPKAQALFGLALLSQISLFFLSFVFLREILSFWPAIILAIFVLILSFVFHFIFLILADFILWPFDFILKFILISRAKMKLARFPDLKIIAVTGSYGKTTMKEMLAAVLGEKFNILKTPENINTPLGIARLVLEELRPATQIFLVEMGAYQRGDIARLCRLTPPDIAILTGINESHLERFGSLQNTIAAKLEIIDNLKPTGIAVFNADSELVMKSYLKHLRGQKVFFYTAGNQPAVPSHVADRDYSASAGQNFSIIDEKGKTHRFKTEFLADYIAGTIMACFLIGRELGLMERDIVSGIAICRPVEHRLKPFVLPNDSIVIDDSYNGNPTGVREAIRVLGRFVGRRKIFITPGLVETGSATPKVHMAIGRQLAEVADLVVLVRNSVTPFIKDGLLANGFSEKKILWFNKITDANSVLPQLMKKGDVVLFQNDWPDNYF